MLSHGAQRNGILEPEQGAQRAKRAGMRIYTIALGTPSGTVSFGFGPYEQTISVPPDPDTLRRISTITGGRFFAAPSAAALRSAYRTIETRGSTAPQKTEATAGFGAAGARPLPWARVLS